MRLTLKGTRGILKYGNETVIMNEKSFQKILKLKLIVTSLFLFLFMFSSQFIQAAQFYWTIETVDSVGVVGKHSALGFNGTTPHIAYYDETTPGLKYATKSGGVWTLETVDTSGNSGTETDIAFNGSAVGISYKGNSHDLKFASKTGGVWTVETVDAVELIVGEDSSLAYDSGNPVITYSSLHGTTFERSLKFAKKTGGVWNIETADSSSAIVGWASSVAIDNNGDPAVVYSDQTNSDLKYGIRSDTPSWNQEVLDGNGGTFTSLDFFSNGDPAAAYRRQSDGHLVYATKSGGAWSFETIQTETPSYVHLIVDDSGDPNVIYHSGFSSTIKVATKSGGVWSIENVTGGTGSFLGADIDSNGSIGISSWLSGSNDLRYMFAEQGNLLNGANSDIDVRFDVGVFTGSSESGGITADSITVTGDGRLRKETSSTSESEWLAASFIGDVFANMDLALDNSTLVGTATLTFNYADILSTLLAAGYTEDGIRIFHNHPTLGKEQLPVVSQDFDADTITVTTTSFSDFSIGVNPEPATILLLGAPLLALLRRKK